SWWNINSTEHPPCGNELNEPTVYWWQRLVASLTTSAAFLRASHSGVMTRLFALIVLNRGTPGRTKPNRSCGSDTLPLFKNLLNGPINSTLTCLDPFSRGCNLISARNLGAAYNGFEELP